MRVFVQFYDGQPFDHRAYIAYCGFKDLGHDVIAYEDIGEVPLLKRRSAEPDKILVGCIEDTIAYLNKNDIDIPIPLNIPDELLPFAKRKVWSADMNSFKSHAFPFPLFIKPANDLKLFEARVIDETSINDLDELFPFAGETQCLLSEPLEILSEYRGFVVGRKLVGLKHYSGDFTLFPNADIIQAAIETYHSAPIAYTIDLGITSKGETILVECNDGWAVDAYGLDGKIYAAFLLARWLELVA